MASQIFMAHTEGDQPTIPELPPMPAGPPDVPPVTTPSDGSVLPNYAGSGYFPPPGATYLPSTAPSAPFQSIVGLGWCVVVLLGVSFLLDMVGVVSGLLQTQLLSRMSDPSNFSMAEATRNDNHVQLVGILQLVTLVFTAIFLLTWMYRAYRNLPALGAQGLTLSPGWAAGGFFVPFLNLVRPYQAMSEIWRVSDPRSPQEDPMDWLRRSTSPLVGFWWGFWLCSGFAGSVSFRLMMGALVTDSQDRIEGLVTGTWCQIASDCFSLLAGPLLMALVLIVSGRQEQRRKLIAPQDLRAGNSTRALAPILTGFGAALLLVVTSMVVLGLQGVGTAWQEFSPPEAGFRVSMPGSPVPQTQSDNGVTVYMYLSNDETAQYLSSYFDVAEDGTSVDAAATFDAMEKLKVETLHGTLAEAHDITFGAYHGRDFIVNNPPSNGVRCSRFQLILVGVRIFQLMIMGDTETIHGANADRFFKSLTISYQPPAVEWHKFSPPDKGYTVSMPGTPTLQTEKDGGVTIPMYIGSDGPTSYVVFSVAISKGRVTNPDQVIDAVEKDKAEGTHGTLSEERRIKVGPYTGKNFVLRNTEDAKGQIWRFHIFIAGNRLFLMMVMGDEKAVHSADAEKFFSSIHTGGI